MGSQFTQFRLYRYMCADECLHDLLVRVNRPGYPNYSQAAEDAAESFADSAADYLRAWWEQWLLPRDCRREHISQLLSIGHEPITDELHGPGLRRLTVWTVTVDGELLIGTAPTKEELWRRVDDYLSGSTPPTRPPAVAHDAYFLTERDGEGDLRDA